MSRAISCASSDGRVVVDLVRLDDDADLAPGLDGEALVDALEARRDVLERSSRLM